MPLSILLTATLVIVAVPTEGSTVEVRPAETVVQPAVRAEISPAELRGLPPLVQTFVEESERLRQGSISRLEHELRGLRSGNLSARDRKASMRRVEANLKALYANEQPLARTLWFPPVQGAIGRLPDLGGHVEQVLGPHEMLVTCSFRVDVVEVRHYQQQRETVWRPVTFLIRGLATESISAGHDVELANIFETKGNQAYRTESGTTQTAPVLEPFDLRLVERIWPHMKVDKTPITTRPASRRPAGEAVPPTTTETPR